MVVDCLGQAQNQLFQAGFGLADQFRQVDLAKVGRHHHFEHRHHHLDVVAIVQVHLRNRKGNLNRGKYTAIFSNNLRGKGLADC